MLAIIPSATLLGARGQPVTVEVHVSQGLPGFSIVGLPDEACRESRDRVRAALLSSGLPWPQQRITVNLAPSGVRKGGSGLDLPIAVGVLRAQEQVPVQAQDLAYVGELGLDGSIRRVPGMVPLADAVGEHEVVVPTDCVFEAALVARQGVRGAGSLTALVAALTGDARWPHLPDPPVAVALGPAPDLAEVRGQPVAREALIAAAAGGHHLLMVGPPGAGKTMLAARLPGLLPPLPPDLGLEATMVHSAAGVPLPSTGLFTRPPFRAPHHTASLVAMVGGGTTAMRPGEISLAHAGVLFLDELGEFSPTVLDGLRQPLEEGVVRVTRARGAIDFPARFLLVAATNPCPCGMVGPGTCQCRDSARERYVRRFSGPLMDRFDLRVEVTRPSVHDLLDAPPGEGSAGAAAKVQRAREAAAARGVAMNALIPPHRLDELAPLTTKARKRLRRELERGNLSGRGLHRVHRVARTLADLAGQHGAIDEQHVSAALRLRIDPAAVARRVA